MAVDSLQMKIRKGRSVLAADLSVFPEDIPAFLKVQYPDCAIAADAYIKALLSALKGVVPAVRFRFSVFAMLGTNGLSVLSTLIKKSAAMGFYVLLDAPELRSVQAAEYAANHFFGADTLFPCDGLIISAYPGSDVIKPFLPFCENQKKDLFAIVRTTNKSASEIQDLLFGSRLTHSAAADYVNRYSSSSVGKTGYSCVGIAASATSAESLRNLRIKYPKMFLLVDGVDCSGANAKNCFFAFDKFGHGALVCAGNSIVGAWKAEGVDETNYAELAAASAERLCKNLSRYITVL